MTKHVVEIALGPPGEVLTAARLKQLYDIDVVIGQIAGSDTLVCSPRLNPDRVPGGRL